MEVCFSISRYVVAFLLSGSFLHLKGQDTLAHINQFFTTTSIPEIKLCADFWQLHSAKNDTFFIPATISILFSDSLQITDSIYIRNRGSQRRKICNTPPLQLQFKKSSNEALHSLGKLKLVNGCDHSANMEQLVLKEYLVYRMYNLFTEKSFRVRLVKVRYEDVNKKLKSFSQFAFFIEDIDDLAKRNSCRELKAKYATEQLNREQITILALFEFMIGNTDWAVPLNQNIKLIGNSSEPETDPWAVPYDFDYSGIVNAPYAIPHPDLEIESVTERKYLGYSRRFDELKKTLKIFLDKEEAMYQMITDCPWLYKGSKSEMKNYLQSFFVIAKSNQLIKDQFIKNAKQK